MRVLFAIDPSLAHLYPLVPMAWALQAGGHEVRLASYAGFAGSIAATGLVPVALGDANSLAARLDADAVEPKDPREVDRYAAVLGLDPAERELWYLFYQYLLTPTADYLRPSRPEAGDLIAFARRWRPDLVIWDFTQPAGAVAARVAGAAHARMPPGMDTFGWSYDRIARRRPNLRAAGLDDDPLATLVAPLAERHGVTVDDELLFGQWTIDLLPEGMSLPTSRTRIAVRWVPYTGASVFPDWLHERPDRPRIGFTLGESTRRFIKGDWDRTPTLMRAFAGLDAQVVATLNQLQLDGLESVPANVKVVDWVPMTQLLPTCSALIHHGGMGTFAAATANRVPQLVCDTQESILMHPAGDDSPLGTYRSDTEYGVRVPAERPRVRWVLPAKKTEATPCANFVTGRGAGIRLDHRAHTVEQLREQIESVLRDQSYRDGADSLYRSWLDMPSPADSVAVLERLTREHR